MLKAAVLLTTIGIATAEICTEGYNVDENESCAECALPFTRAAGDDTANGPTVCYQFLAVINGKEYYEFDGDDVGSQQLCNNIDSAFESPTVFEECKDAKMESTGQPWSYHDPAANGKGTTQGNWLNVKPYPCAVQNSQYVIDLSAATTCSECNADSSHVSQNYICVKTANGENPVEGGGGGGGDGSCDSLSTASEYQAAGCCNC